jgi:hypothetical protein
MNGPPALVTELPVESDQTTPAVITANICCGVARISPVSIVRMKWK